MTGPIACGIGPMQQAQRMQSWHELRASLTRTRSTSSGVSLDFVPDPAVARRLLELVVAERQYCPWAEWAITASGACTRLDVIAGGEGPRALQLMFDPTGAPEPAQPPTRRGRRINDKIDFMTDALADRAAAALTIPLQHALDARLRDPADPTGGILFPVGGLAMNPGGTLHGGALSAIMELAGFLALLPGLAVTEHAVTHHISTQILSAGRVGEEVLVTAVVERRTRRIGFITATATVGDRLLARAQITKSVIEIR